MGIKRVWTANVLLTVLLLSALTACGGEEPDVVPPIVSVPPDGRTLSRERQIIADLEQADRDLRRAISEGIETVEPRLRRVERCASDACLSASILPLAEIADRERRGLQERVDRAADGCLDRAGTAYVSALDFLDLAGVYAREGRIVDTARVTEFARDDLRLAIAAIDRCAEGLSD